MPRRRRCSGTDPPEADWSTQPGWRSAAGIERAKAGILGAELCSATASRSRRGSESRLMRSQDTTREPAACPLRRRALPPRGAEKAAERIVCIPSLRVRRSPRKMPWRNGDEKNPSRCLTACFQGDTLQECGGDSATVKSRATRVLVERLIERAATDLVRATLRQVDFRLRLVVTRSNALEEVASISTRSGISFRTLS